MEKVNSVINIPTSLNTEFFKLWLLFLHPFHNLTNREVEVMAAFLKQRFLLSTSVSDPSLLDRIVLSSETKMKVKEELDISGTYLQVVLSKLKKAGVITENGINPKFIPHINKEDKSFTLLFLFEFNDV